MADDLNIAMILRLVDKVTGPAKGVLGTIDKIKQKTGHAGQAAVDWSDRQIAANQQRRAAMQGELAGVFGMGAALYGLTEPAIQAEKRMAEVGKVVEFDSKNGLTQLQSDIRELVTSGGLSGTADGISDIVAAAGRMGVVDESLPDAQKRKELLEFAEATRKMAVAFGITDGAAADSLTLWRQNFRMSQEEALMLGDTINLLGNTMATTEADILSVIGRSGVSGKQAGLMTSELAALSATLLASGTGPERAATGLKNFTNALTVGESATKRQRDAFAELGIDAVDMAKRMQDDAGGGMLAVLDAFEQIEPYRRSALVGDLFGEEGKLAIAPLIDNTELFRQTLQKTADTSQFLGLMEKEYQVQAATTAAQRMRFFEYIKGLSVVVGNQLLPALNDTMATIAPMITEVTRWAEANPEIVATTLKIVAALVGLKAASLLVRLGFSLLLGPVLHLIRWGGILMKVLGGQSLLMARLGGMFSWAAKGGVRVFAGALRWAWATTLLLGRGTALLAKGGVMVLSRALRWAGTAALFLGRGTAWLASNGLKLLLGGIRGVGRALLWMGRLAMANPLGLIITAVAALAYVVWQSWDEIVEWLTAKVDAVKAAFDEGLINGVFKTLAEFNPFTLAFEGIRLLIGKAMEMLGVPDEIVKAFLNFNPFTYALDGARNLIAKAMEMLGVPNDIVQAFRDFSLFDTGMDILQSLWDGMASLVPQMVASISAKLSSIVPGWMKDAWGWVSGGGGDAPAQTAPAGGPPPTGENAGKTWTPQGWRDGGGPVMPGRLYRINERGEEGFIPGTKGTIIPTRTMKAAAAASAMAAPALAAAGSLPAIQADMPRIDTRPAFAATAPPSREVINQGDTIHMTIQAAPGMDARDVAREVERVLARREDERRRDLHDGEGY